jgi:hypothetical protein
MDSPITDAARAEGSPLPELYTEGPSVLQEAPPCQSLLPARLGPRHSGTVGAASTWAFVNDGDWEERALRVLRLVMDGLRYKPR